MGISALCCRNAANHQPPMEAGWQVVTPCGGLAASRWAACPRYLGRPKRKKGDPVARSAVHPQRRVWLCARLTPSKFTVCEVTHSLTRSLTLSHIFETRRFHRSPVCTSPPVCTSLSTGVRLHQTRSLPECKFLLRARACCAAPARLLLCSRFGLYRGTGSTYRVA